MKSKNRPSVRLRHSGQRFPEDILAAIRKEKILGIRAGRESTHRVIGVWAVVVEGRVFVRSWGCKPQGWHRAFLEDPYGSVFIGEHEIPIHTVQTRSKRLKDLVSAAYGGNTIQRGRSDM